MQSGEKVIAASGKVQKKSGYTHESIDGVLECYATICCEFIEKILNAWNQKFINTLQIRLVFVTKELTRKINNLQRNAKSVTIKENKMVETCMRLVDELNQSMLETKIKKYDFNREFEQRCDCYKNECVLMHELLLQNKNANNNNTINKLYEKQIINGIMFALINILNIAWNAQNYIEFNFKMKQLFVILDVCCCLPLKNTLNLPQITLKEETNSNHSSNSSNDNDNNQNLSLQQKFSDIYILDASQCPKQSQIKQIFNQISLDKNTDLFKALNLFANTLWHIAVFQLQ